MNRTTLAALAIALGAALLLTPTCFHDDFVLDDSPIVLQNPVVREAQWGRAWSAPWWPVVPGDPVPPNWRPLTSSWLALDHAIWGVHPARGDFDPGPFHAVNVLLYGALTWCVWLLARRLTTASIPALIATLWFAVHPAHVEAVAPLVGRADLLAAIAVVGGLTAWIRFRDGDGERWRVVAVAAFALGLLSKESAAPLLGVIPIYDWLVRGDSPRDWFRRPVLRYAPLVGVAVVWLGLRAVVLQSSTLHLAGEPGAGAAAWLFGFGRNGAWSGLLTFLPFWTHHVVTTLPKEAALTYPPMTFGAAGLVVLALTGALSTGWWWARTRSGVVAFCWLAAVLTWLPTSGLLPIGAGVALRFLLLPTVFVVIALALGLERLAARAGTGAPAVRIAVTAITVLVGGGTALFQQRAWASNLAFSEAVLRQAPDNYSSLVSLGGQLSFTPRRAEGRRAIERAIELDPERKMAWRQMLVFHLYDHRGQKYGPTANLAAAEEVAAKLIALDDAEWNPRFELALLAEHRKDRAAALRWHREAYATVRQPRVKELIANHLRRLGVAVPEGGR